MESMRKLQSPVRDKAEIDKNKICPTLEVSPEFFSYVHRLEPEEHSLTYLLVMPRVAVNNDQQYMFPLGLPYISSAMKATGHRVKTLNLNYKDEDLQTLLKRNLVDVDVIMVGGLSGQFRALKDIITVAKQIKPSIIAVVGGGVMTADPESAMKAFDNVDYGSIGEGEVTNCELADALEGRKCRKEVNGIIYWENGKLIKTPQREQIRNIDILPWPDYDGFEYELMIGKLPIDHFLGDSEGCNRMGLMIYSRGCPYLCTFCFHSTGNRYRHRSLDGFFKEFDFMVNKYKLDSFNFIDEYFMRDVSFVREFCKRVKPYHMKWVAQGRVDNVTDEMIVAMKDAGCYCLQFGFESACDTVLESMRKHIQVAQINKAIEVCDRHGMELQGTLIFGDISETMETAEVSLKWYEAHRKYQINLNWILVYPGTYLYQYALEKGIIKDRVEYLANENWRINVSKLSDDERKKLSQKMLSLQYGTHDKLIDVSVKRGTGGKVEIIGNCPFCGHRGHYKDLDIIRPKISYVCPNCLKTLNLFGFDYLQIRPERIQEKLQGRRVAIWPVIMNLGDVIRRLGLQEYENVILVDSDPYKWGNNVGGKLVASPDVITEKDVDLVLMSLSTATAQEICHMIQEKYPTVKETCFFNELLLECAII